MSKRFQRWTSIVTCLSLLIPQFALGAAANNASRNVRDIELQNGVLVGQMMTITGQPAGEAPALLVDRHGDRREIRTDKDGNFRVAKLRGGAYVVHVGDGVVPVRLWAEGTAPPAAQESLLMLNSTTTVRGQGGGLVGLLSNPWFIAAAVAAAIAIPIALDDDGS
jgi:hypothetical protein